jgi:hypothetical protein
MSTKAEMVEALLEEARRMPVKAPWGFLKPYAPAVSELRAKRYSFKEIAEFLSKRFGFPVSRASVCYVHRVYGKGAAR